MNTENVSRSLSTAIVALLRKEGKTNREIADLMDLTESAISHVRKGNRSFTITGLAKLEKSLCRPLPLLFLDALEDRSIPKELRPQYKSLRKVLNNSAELRKELDSA